MALFDDWSAANKSLEESRMAKRMFVSREGEPMTLTEMTKAMLAEGKAPMELQQELAKVGIGPNGEDLQERAREVDRERVRRGYPSDGSLYGFTTQDYTSRGRFVPGFGQVGPTVDKRTRAVEEFMPGQFYESSGVYIPTSAPQWVWQRDQSPTITLPRWTLYDECRRPRYVATDMAVVQAKDPKLLFETCTRKAIQERSLAEAAMGRQAPRDFPASWDEQQNGRLRPSGPDLVAAQSLRDFFEGQITKDMWGAERSTQRPVEPQSPPQPRALECVGASSRKIVLED